MNSIWAMILLVAVCVLAGYYLTPYWAPFGWIGFIAAFGIIGGYLFNRNKRIQ